MKHHPTRRAAAGLLAALAFSLSAVFAACSNAELAGQRGGKAGAGGGGGAEKAASVAGPSAENPLRVLFLGDNGPHKPAERSRQLLPYLASRGIDARYSEDPGDLNPQRLGEFDVLLIYANNEQITPEQEQALLGFVEGGGGFVPVHCASYCFHNSPKYIDLVGAQFKSHGGEVFKARITQPEHPAMLGLHEFSSWDETYVHDKHNEDRTVVMVREEKDGRAEPYSWTREVGKGRVFYTALGHDERTWGEMGFLRLVENGIRWAAKREDTIPAAGRKDLPPLAFIDAPGPIPFYPESDKWGVEAEPLTKMQAPLEPGVSLRYLELPAGFRAELYAAEPDIVKVIAKTWDERGRLWVAETLDYPNDLQPPGKGNDRIRICEDTDGDGRADKFTVFADRLSIPTSIVHAGGGLVVAQAPDVLLLQDTDGDDKADVRKVLFTGWNTNDTHAGPSNLRYGFDNWVWGTVGYAGFNGEVGGKPIRFGQGVFRFKPDGSAIEFLTSTSNNTWGLGQSETGQVFASTANNDHSVYLAIPNRYYESVRGWSGLGSGSIASSQRYHPIGVHRQMDWHGKFTAAAGHSLYTARAFPERYWNRIAFVTEGTGHLIHQAVLEPRGSDYAALDGYNLAASNDEWTSPVTAEVGPDGAVWVSDWYNYIFQHNPVPHGFENGRGNAYVTPVRDKEHGRVYRIVYGGADVKPAPAPALGKAPPERLVAALGHDNLFWRLTAQRLLVERGKADVMPQLAALLTDAKTDAIGNAPGALHALWTMRALGGSDPQFGTAAREALRHPAAPVRKAALDVLPRDEAGAAEAVLASGTLEDADPQVRLAALLALAEVPSTDEAGAAVVAAMAKPENAKDKWIPQAATAAAARHDAGFLKAVLAAAGARGKAERAREAVNLLPNASFEETSGAMPAGWVARNWQGAADAALDEEVSHSGKRSVRVTSGAPGGADTSVSARVAVTPQTSYRLSAWIRTRDLDKGSGLGALMNVHELQGGGPTVRTEAVTGTTDWTRVQASFNSGNFKELTINCLIGGWGRATGTAWYDDLRLEPLGEAAGPLDEMVRVVTTHYAQRGPVESVVETLSALDGADEGTAQSVLDGLLAGWPAEAKLPDAARGDEALLAVSEKLSDDNRTRLATLAQRLGRGELFAKQTAAAQKALLASMNDAKLDAAARVGAAQRLLGLADTKANVEAILKQVTPQSPPEIAAAMTSALGASRQDAAGAAILKKWNGLPPSARKAAVDVLLRRPAWHAALLDAMEQGTLGKGDLAAEQAQQLVAVAPDEAAAERAKKLLTAAGRLPDADRQKTIDQLMPVAEQRGDVEAGKVIFQANCVVCHKFAGEGGVVGPDLTGSGKNPRHEILLNIIDPNRSVEGNFRLWIVQTKDGQTVSGRLDTESQTTVELLDATGKKQVIQRKDIKRMVSTPTSVMPEGFELLSPKDLADLLEFVAQPVEAPK
jgi:putative membrane-bound dehydrogenase-like protein